MAKKTAENTETTPLSAVEKANLAVRKQFGENMVKSATLVVKEEQIVIPFSPALDLGLGGRHPRR